MNFTYILKLINKASVVYSIYILKEFYQLYLDVIFIRIYLYKTALHYLIDLVKDL